MFDISDKGKALLEINEDLQRHVHTGVFESMTNTMPSFPRDMTYDPRGRVAFSVSTYTNFFVSD